MHWPLIVFLLGFISIFILRIPIALGMLMTSTFYFLAAGMDVALVAQKVLSSLFEKYIIMAVPLFVFTAFVMNTGRVTEMVFRFANGLVGRFRGGMGHVNVVASIIFSGRTGSAVADASGLGIMEIEGMRQYGYPDDFSAAVTSSSATIGPVFPPSIPMVFYAMLSGASIGNLFLGGMAPGLLIGFALMGYIAIISKIRNYPYGAKYTLRQFIVYTIKAFTALFTPGYLFRSGYPDRGRCPGRFLGDSGIGVCLSSHGTQGALEGDRTDDAHHRHAVAHRGIGFHLQFHRGQRAYPRHDCRIYAGNY